MNSAEMNCTQSMHRVCVTTDHAHSASHAVVIVMLSTNPTIPEVDVGVPSVLYF